MSESFEKRGVENPAMVDLITYDDQAPAVTLSMLEPRPWGSDPAQLEQLEIKIDNYLGYVIEGFFVRDYPQYDTLAVRVQLDCRETPRAEDEAFFAAAERACARHGIAFSVRVVANLEAEQFGAPVTG